MENKGIVLENACSHSDSTACARLRGCLGDLSDYDVQVELSWEETLDPSPHNSSSTVCFPNPMQSSAAPFSSCKPAAQSPGRVCFQLACAIIIFFLQGNRKPYGERMEWDPSLAYRQWRYTPKPCAEGGAGEKSAFPRGTVGADSGGNWWGGWWSLANWWEFEARI